MEKDILDKATYWSQGPVFDEGTRREVASLLDRGDEGELAERFYRDLEFGTGGMRGIVGAGTSRMNVYNVRKATTALAQYLLDSYDKNEELRVAVSFDSRHYSEEFAMEAAAVLAAHGIRALVTGELRPVPVLSFMVRHFSCHAGICVTASHNPPEYNGYKVYWKDGAQLIPPHDQAIIDRYRAIRSYDEIPRLTAEQGQEQDLIRRIGEELDQAYLGRVASLCIHPCEDPDFKVVYSPIHGSGLFPVVEGLKRFGFRNTLVVEQQRHPDGDFPTVRSPNPEDPAALKMAVELAEKEGAQMVLATDPDCDRIGMVVREGGDWLWLNGNQIGSLLIEYVLRSPKESGRLPESPLVIKTIVTTELQRDIAAHWGADCEDTLTGFKWIGGLIEEYETGQRQPYKEYICGGEESYGFLADHFVRDKDGVIGCCIAAEMVAWYRSRGESMGDVLRQLFRRHGVYEETLHTLTLPGKEGAEKIEVMMRRLRSAPPTLIDGVAVQLLRDLQNGQEYENQNGAFQPRAEIPLPSSNVLQFILVDGTKVSARPSGTEPKIKFYVSVREEVDAGISGEQLEAVQARCKERARRIEETFVAMSR